MPVSEGRQHAFIRLKETLVSTVTTQRRRRRHEQEAFNIWLVSFKLCTFDHFNLCFKLIKDDILIPNTHIMTFQVDLHIQQIQSSIIYKKHSASSLTPALKSFTFLFFAEGLS